MAFALLAGALLGVATGPARADFATECAAPTRTITGPSSDAITVAAGEVVLLTGGTFTGGINSLASTGLLCIAADATFQPGFANNASGAIINAGDTTLPSMAVNAGFRLENEGQLVLSGSINTNGRATITNAAGATLNAPSGITISNDTELNNAGTATFPGGITVNDTSDLINSGTLSASQLIVNGVFINTGDVTDTGNLILNGSSTDMNACRMSVGGSEINNGFFTNNGVLEIEGDFTNNGAYVESADGITTGTGFTNDGQVTGFGEYLFTGNTVNHNQFVGSSSADPIVFFDTTQTVPGAIFDLDTGTVVNTIRAVVTPPDPDFRPAGCAAPAAPSADVETTKTGPATVGPGGEVTYTITVTNHGPDPAEDVVVSDLLPEASVGLRTSRGLMGSARSTAVIGTLAPGQTLTYTVTVRAPESGTMLDVVSSTSSTPDPDESNNDGSSPNARVVTEVLAASPSPTCPGPSPSSPGPTPSGPATATPCPTLPITGQPGPTPMLPLAALAIVAGAALLLLARSNARRREVRAGTNADET